MTGSQTGKIQIMCGYEKSLTLCVDTKKVRYEYPLQVENLNHSMFIVIIYFAMEIRVKIKFSDMNQISFKISDMNRISFIITDMNGIRFITSDMNQISFITSEKCDYSIIHPE